MIYIGAKTLVPVDEMTEADKAVAAQFLSDRFNDGLEEVAAFITAFCSGNPKDGGDHDIFHGVTAPLLLCGIAMGAAQYAARQSGVPMADLLHYTQMYRDLAVKLMDDRDQEQQTCH